MKRYNFKTVEQKWQNFWSDNKSYEAKINKNKKFYCLEMFPIHQEKFTWDTLETIQ